jgi:hypothetical protein
MQTITTIGLDIAKSVFQVHGVDAGGQVVIRRQLKRRYVLTFFQKLSPCLVGIEACASAHHWSRELQALGHTVRLMPPAYVKPYVKRQMRLTRTPFARRLPEPTCGSCRPRLPSRERPGATPRPPSVHPSADRSNQCNPGPSCRVRSRCAGRASRCRGTAQCRRRSKRQSGSGNGSCVSPGIRNSIAQDQGSRSWSSTG